MNHPTFFLDRDNKTKLVPASFPGLLELPREKTGFSLKSVVIMTVIIFLHCSKTNQTGLFR